MTMNRNISTFIGCDAEYRDAKTVIFGAPFDSTTSYRPGTRFASRAIRNESYGIETFSPYQDKALEDYKIFDGGELDLCFGNPARVLDEIEDFTLKLLKDDKLPVMIGGEHLVTLGGVRAVRQKHHGLHIIHFDAHADVRNDYMGETLSHATVIRRCWELLGDGKIYQFGIRSGEKSEFEWAKGHTYL
ncbi:MAG: agmatinase, partial [Oscillospiraceae bacterium]